MLLTPLHFAPGILAKSVVPGFSATVFVLASGIIGLQPFLASVLTGDPAQLDLHNWFAATLLGAIAGHWGRPLCEGGLKLWNRLLPPARVRALGATPAISRGAAMASALLGTWSHVFIDSVLYKDIDSGWPFVAPNGLRDVISPGLLAAFCLVSALYGSLRLLVRRWDDLAPEEVATGARHSLPGAETVRRGAGILQGGLAILAVGMAVLGPLQLSAQAQMSRTNFDSAAWRQAGSEPVAGQDDNNPRLGMLGDLTARLESGRPTRAAVIDMLGQPMDPDAQDELEYWVGQPKWGYPPVYGLVVTLDEYGRVQRAFLDWD